jgi:hypothetical protein
MRGITREHNNSDDLIINSFWQSDYEDPDDHFTLIIQDVIPGEFEGQIFIPDLSVFFKHNED